MKEFCELVWDEPFFPDSFAKAVFSNIDGEIIGFSDNEQVLNNMLDVLKFSSAWENVADEDSGMERIFGGMFGIGGRYSSDNGFTERDFLEQSKTLKFKKELKKS